MEKKNVLPKILVIAGTVLVWLPILAPVLIFIAMIIKDSRFIFDYLMPVELFLFALVGGGLLLWAALWTRSHLKLTGWGLGIAIGLRIGLELLVFLRDRTSGETKLTDLWNVLLLVWTIAISVSIIFIGIGGVMLLRKLFRPSQLP